MHNQKLLTMCYVEPLVPVAVCRLYRQKHVDETDRKGQTTATAACVCLYINNQAHQLYNCADALRTFF